MYSDLTTIERHISPLSRVPSDLVFRSATAGSVAVERRRLVVGDSSYPVRATNHVIVGFTAAAAFLALSHHSTSPTLLPKDHSVFGEAFAPAKISKAMPVVFEESAAEMEALRELQDGWDGSGSIGPTIVDIAAALEFLKSLPDDIQPPEPTVDFDGTVGWFWDDGIVYASVSIRDEETFAYFVRNRQTAQKTGGIGALDPPAIPDEFIEAIRAE
ncbi:hypothetical protein [Sinorhizobium fredii]|uniref:hypothetical protein n=1 Tax=Rhizobium fredii TaxID=380 RepID=UPI0012963B33|nr:hypothetical protein [Sinorhizobium fredii]MQW94092.1 hypothetical protein [Sinorhizobium fredii]